MKISTITKYLDSEKFVHSLEKKMPLLLVGGGGAFALADTIKHAPEDKAERRKHFIKSGIITAAAMGATLIGARTQSHHCCHNHGDFKKIWDLSKFGLISVAGGVLGGIAADKVTNSGSKKSTADKLKEGLFQFLANIALCNVGAAITLGGAKLLENKGVIKPLNRLQKMGVLLTGIVGAGIVGGSAIANYIGKKIIDKDSSGKLYDERTPEALDVALHADDVTAAGVVSGFRWIEPVIPLLYFISGYRAGIGYRNGETSI